MGQTIAFTYIYAFYKLFIRHYINKKRDLNQLKSNKIYFNF